MMPAANDFPKPMRLSGRKRIEGLFRQGQSGFVYPLRYVYEVGEETGGGLSVLVSVSKRYHKRAVKRNLLKRRMRESFRTSRHGLARDTEDKGRNIDVAILYCTKDVVDFKTVDNAIRKILEKIRQGL